MASKFRLLTKRFLLSCNVIVVVVFLLSCLVPYLNPQKWWFISFLGLAFPFLLLLVFVFGVTWIFLLKPKYSLVSFLAILISMKSIGVLFAFHNRYTFNQNKQPGQLRIATWNVARFVELRKSTNKGSATRLKMFDLIREQNADVLCLQEFHTSTDSNYYNNIKPIQEELGYPYYFFSFDNDGDNHYYSSIIFSRYPIVDTGKIRYPRPTLPDVLLHTDLKVGNDTFRVYTTHLQSLQFGRKDYDKIDKIKNARDSLMANTRNILSKLKKGFSYRSIQARIAHEVMMNSPHPTIFCGDLNDVPNSYTYAAVRGDMQDAFLKKGSGIGRTFSGLSPTLRIDYIFADQTFQVQQFKRVFKNYSDHYMLVADLSLKRSTTTSNPKK